MYQIRSKGVTHQLPVDEFPIEELSNGGWEKLPKRSNRALCLGTAGNGIAKPPIPRLPPPPSLPRASPSPPPNLPSISQ
ncbi:hypothetical protein RvY_01960 [Ramazzottius varieornatus]|uniref:Uncharacterized protein n=1 Tax=Ramazzottius varieornatus TaxID=947166 RepID=A0A1D1UI67_RAMVA|nr:hypothetical protein RvY_01960 [Ramazzottius varieornatus]